MRPELVPPASGREHAARLLRLVRRFCASEQSLRAVLADIDAMREAAARRAARAQLLGEDAEAARRRCRLLELECDEVSIELAHVRLALRGAREELARAQAGDAELVERQTA